MPRETIAIVTFDLNSALPPVYAKVKKELGKLELKKQIISGKTGNEVKLPSNTFIAKFSGNWTDKASHELCKYLKDAVSEVIKKQKISGKVFVLVGKSWAWNTKSIKGKKQ